MSAHCRAIPVLGAVSDGINVSVPDPGMDSLPRL